jgi:GTP-binding protein
MSKPIVALVGRPNVGKSTLFNRLAGERKAVVDDTPGTTRDRLFAETEWNGFSFYIVDTGGIDPTPDSKGKQPLSIGSADFIEDIRLQAEIAIREADAVLFIVDGISGLVPADIEVANILRRLQDDKPSSTGEVMRYPPILLVVNKCDHQLLEDSVYQFYELGLGEPYSVSALHGIGTGDLLDDLVATLKSNQLADRIPPLGEEDAVKIAIVGKPNSGKSTLLNALLGEERAIVSPIAGTTRDAIDTPLSYNGIPITLIDTAGIRRRGRIQRGVEQFSVLRSMQAIERADVSLLVLDAINGITAQDTHIAGYIQDAWKSAVVLVNKWDAIPKDSTTMQQFTRIIRNELKFMDYVPILFISAKNGQRVNQVLPLALRVQEERMVRLSTSQINRILQEAQDLHPAPAGSGKPLKIYYGTQVRSDPPTFMIYVNNPKLAHSLTCATLKIAFVLIILF